MKENTVSDDKVLLHFWDAVWDLRIAEYPCDVHFVDWLEKKKGLT